LNRCLSILGADVKDVYANPYSYGGHGQHRPVNGSIYARYTLDELQMMLKGLHRQAIKRFHHDLTGDEEPMKEINWAWQTGRRLIQIRRGIF